MATPKTPPPPTYADPVNEMEPPFQWPNIAIDVPTRDGRSLLAISQPDGGFLVAGYVLNKVQAEVLGGVLAPAHVWTRVDTMLLLDDVIASLQVRAGEPLTPEVIEERARNLTTALMGDYEMRRRHE